MNDCGLLAAGVTSSVVTSGDSQYEYEISLACQGLPNDSSGLAPNTYAVVQCQNEAGGKWLPNGHTEIVEVHACICLYIYRNGCDVLLPILAHRSKCSAVSSLLAQCGTSYRPKNVVESREG